MISGRKQRTSGQGLIVIADRPRRGKLLSGSGSLWTRRPVFGLSHSPIKPEDFTEIKYEIFHHDQIEEPNWANKHHTTVLARAFASVRKLNSIVHNGQIRASCRLILILAEDIKAETEILDSEIDCWKMLKSTPIHFSMAAYPLLVPLGGLLPR